MWTLSFVASFTYVFHIRKVIINHHWSVIFPEGSDWALLRPNTIRSRDLSLLYNAHLSWCLLNILRIVFNESCRYCDASFGVYAFLKLVLLVVLEHDFLRFPIYWKIDKTDEFLVFVTHSKESDRAENQFKSLFCRVQVYRRHFWRLRNIHRWRLLCGLSTFDLRQVDEDLFFIKIGHPLNLFYPLNLRLKNFWVVYLANHLQVNAWRNLHLDMMNS